MIELVRDGCTIKGMVIGPAEAPPLLFVHGFPLSSQMWMPTVAELSGRFRCVLPDLRGLGTSTIARPEGVTLATYADDLAAFLDRVGEARAGGIVGLSMGGMIALEFVRRHRARALRLVLCDCRVAPEGEEGKAQRRKRAELALKRGAGGVREIADLMIATLVARDAVPAVRSGLLEMMRTASPMGVAAASLALAERGDLRPVVRALDLPTLVVVGDRDEITPPALMREIHGMVPAGVRAPLGEIAGAGHVPPMETPAGFQRVLAEFLDAPRPATVRG